MKVLKGTLSFVMGIIIGILLFVISIGGAVFALASGTTIGQLQNTVGVEVINEDSEIFDESIWDMVKLILEDVQNLDELNLKTLIEKYGLPIPSEISGIDITKLFEYPLAQIPDNLDKVINSVTLEDIGTLIGVDFSSYGIPVLKNNLNNNVQTALDTVLAGFSNVDNLTLRYIEQNFGLSLSSELFDILKDSKVSNYGEILYSLSLSELLNIDTDIFIPNGTNSVYTQVNHYEKINKNEFNLIKPNAKKYIQSVENKKVKYKELRFAKNENGEYFVDNSSNSEDFDVQNNKKDYYRLIEFENYDENQSYDDSTEFFIKSYKNKFINIDGEYHLKMDNYFSLNQLYFSDNDLSTLNSKVNSNQINIVKEFYYKDKENNFIKMPEYGLNSEALANSDSLLEKGLDGYLKIHDGNSQPAIQKIAESTIKELSQNSSQIMNLKLKDIFVIDENSSNLLITMQDKTLAELIDATDNLNVSNIIPISQDAYVKDENGQFVKVVLEEQYKAYQPSFDNGLQRYNLTYLASDNGVYVLYEGNYYIFNNQDTRFENCQRYNKNYIEDENGNFVKQATKSYFTLYSPELHENYTRYKNIDGYIFANKSQLENGTDLFRFNYETQQMVDYQELENGDIFCLNNASSKILQRLANVSLTDFNSTINNITLGEILDIDTDIYIKIAENYDDMSIFNTNMNYFYFENGIYKNANVFDETFRTEHQNISIYKISKNGNGNAILKRLAFIKINNIASSMTEIISQTYLQDLLSISQNYAVRNFDGSNEDDVARFIVDKNINYTTTLDTVDNYYTFVYDTNGNFYKTSELFLPANIKQIKEDGNSISFGYSKVYEGTNVLEGKAKVLEKSLEQNIYYKNNENEYVFNPAITTYLANKGNFDNLYYRDTTLANLTLNTHYVDNLYVRILGQYIAYDNTNPAHIDMDKYFRYSNGYFVVSADSEQSALTKYVYDYSLNNFVETVSFDANDQVYIKITADANGNYYYSQLDSNFDAENDITYSKKLCDEIYSENENGNFVFINNKYIEYDNLVHNGIQRYSKYYGYLANLSQVALKNGDTYETFISNNKVEIATEKSATVLCAFARQKATINSLDDVFKSFTLADIMQIEPQSIFNEEDIKNSSIANLNMVLQTKLNNMTIKELLEWGNISNLQPQVYEILKDITIIDFFSSLEYNVESGTINVNILKLYHIE